MWPSVRAGAWVDIVPTLFSKLRPGDVAAFERNGTLVVHRIVTIEGDHAVFAGDSLRHSDGAIPASRVLGRVEVVAQKGLSLRLPGRWHLRALWRALSRRWHLRRRREKRRG